MRMSGSGSRIWRVASTPSHLGHGDVHEDDVGPQLLGQADGLVAVAGLAHDVEALVGHRPAQALAQHPVVVGQHQPDGHVVPPPWSVGAGCDGAGPSARRAVRSAVTDGRGRAAGCRTVAGGSSVRTRLQRTRVPLPGSLAISRVAPMLEARSRMPRMP